MTLHQFAAGSALEGAEAGARVRIEGQEARHALSVHRLQPGEELLLADGAGLVGRARVDPASETGKSPVLVAEVLELAREERPVPRLHLVQALAKGDRDLAAIETATELGAASVVPWEADRSVARWPAAKREKSAAKWRSLLEAAAKQSRSPWTPALHELVGTPALARRVAEWAERGALVVVLHEDAEDAAAQVFAGTAAEDVYVVVGPEGGISEKETRQLVEAGAQLASLGRLILRASSAGPAAMATAQAVWAVTAS